MELKAVTKMAAQLVAEQRNIAHLEAQLVEAKRSARRLAEVDLPEAMREIGLSELRLSDGTVLTLRDNVRANINDSNRSAALAWLTEHGFGGLIKTEVKVTFGRGEHDAASALAAATPGSVLVETVHPQTLLAFIREQMEAGTPPPFDVFNISPYSEVKVKL